MNTYYDFEYMHRGTILLQNSKKKRWNYINSMYIVYVPINRESTLDSYNEKLKYKIKITIEL